MSLNYSIVIRTTGKGGEKYKKLLDSIKCQTLQPNEILVVLPEGVDLPPEKLGTEKFIFAQKGMMTQRIFGVDSANNDIVLCLDDDLEFDCDFVKKMLEPFESGICDIAVGELLAFLPKEHSFKNISSISSLSAIPMGKRTGKYVKIIRSGGWKYHRFNPDVSRFLPTESAAGAMFMITKNAWKKLRFCDEMWAQHGTNAPMDDQIMFYKAFLLGLKTVVVTNANFIHNDSKNSQPDIKSILYKSFNSGFNNRIFWHRFIYKQQQSPVMRVWSKYLFLHRLYVGLLFQLVTSIYKKERRVQIKERLNGDTMAKKFINSKEYKNLSNFVN